MPLEIHGIGTVLTPNEAAKRLGQTATTVRRWVHQGKLSRISIANKIYILPDEVDDLIKVEPRTVAAE
ncbi:helix-turn-helix domain-containing protein [Ruegeria sp. HKCCA4707]|uniref:helix-turn-helix domain-containing protein n=1 Tax=Ruegeria sp. HKCCA4707 TaxID=2682984 RepID=UPI001487F56B|nr:helix-turn-helix domain-containing protein [Ruegeria sp. HKCCA4707]